MKKLAFLLSLILVAALSMVRAQSPEPKIGIVCQQVLIPTVEQSTSDYRRIQAYAFLYADHIYDLIKKKDSGDHSADALTEVFIGEYKESHTKEEFIMKVHDRLVKENYHSDESDSRSYLKKSLTEEQLNNWTKCVQAVTSEGALLLAVRYISNDSFSLVPS